MSSSLRTSKSLEKNDEGKFVIRNGKILLEKLIASCNGKYNPFRNFTAEELEAATNNSDPEKVITIDSSYKLYKGLLQDRPISVMKFVPKLKADQSCFNCVAFASQMSHKNILKSMGCCLESEIPILVFEFGAYGTLDNQNRDPCGSHLGPLLLKLRLKIAVEITNAFAYIHVAFSWPIVFRDVKLSNILFQEQYVAKIFNFSASLSLPEGKTHIKDKDKVIATFGFVAPEYLKTAYCNEKCDVYSFGALLLEILTGKIISRSSCFEMVQSIFYSKP